jgi:7,8-dihydropterin-6-yl-methyl-4-(beta-D-ribofuranosyl)aminobenzene 5'-phosphate synthase
VELLVKLSVLTDNTVKKRGLLAEHGLSLFIEHEGFRILFDTGQSSVYCHNAAVMGIELGKADCIVLSHGHYDHCGGLVQFPKADPFLPVYIHPEAIAAHYKADSSLEGYGDIGIPWSFADYPEIKRKVMLSEREVEIASGIHLVSEIPIQNALEDLPEGYFVYENGTYIKASFRDEQMLIWVTPKGLSIFLGCSHPGIISCLLHARKLFPGNKIHSLAAGMHLDHCGPRRLDAIIHNFIEMEIQMVIPLHCTGMPAAGEMKKRLGERCHMLYAGDEMEL